MEKTGHSYVQALIIFWLGILTGAIVVGLLFFYKSLEPVDYKSSLLSVPKTYSVPLTTTPKVGQSLNPGIVAPKINPYAFGDGDGF